MSDMTHKKWLDLGIFAIALFIFFALKSGFNYLWDAFSLPIPELLSAFPFSAADVLAFIVVLAGLIGVRSLTSVKTFGQEVVLELSKVTWPEKRETMLSTGIVIVMLSIASLCMFLFDLLWGTLTKSLLEF